MAMRDKGILVPALLGTICLAAALGCGGHTYYSLPEVDSMSPNPAAVGATVTIQGQFFKGVSNVSFGDAPAASYNVNSSTQISAVVPDNATTGPVTVVNPEGAGSSYYNNPLKITPQVTSLNPTSGPAGTSVQVTGYGLFGTTAVTINGVAVAPADITYNNPNQITVVVAAGTTTGEVVVTASGLASTGGPTFTVQ